jgi:hypothetical protein
MRYIEVELDVPDDLARFHLPPGVNARLNELLDRQDRGVSLTAAERLEAQRLVDLAELHRPLARARGSALPI